MVLTRRETLIGAGSLGLGVATGVGAAIPVATPASGALSNPESSAAAQALYRYLWSIYRTRTLTGQQEQNFTFDGGRAELDYLQRVSGKLPAVLGLDYIDPRDQQGVNDRATRWYREGGIVTLCWHWGAPDIGTGYDNAKRDFDVAKALTPGTPQNRAMARDLAHVGDLLAQLRDRGVPVLWRPFHEFSGDWFWWGKHGPDAFKALWRLMYEYFVRSRKLDNLLWVLGYAGQTIDSAYYPGRAYVDIAGADTYAHDHGNQAPLFRAVERIVRDTVPICLHENGPIPDPATLGPDADWLYFMTWHTSFITDGKTNPPDLIRRYYASDRYLTKDELPDRHGR